MGVQSVGVPLYYIDFANTHWIVSTEMNPK